MNTQTLALTVILGLAGAALAAPGTRALDPARFFANEQVQAQAPGAFAVAADALPVLEAIERVAPAQRAALVSAIRGQADLAAEVAAFPGIGWTRQLAVLKRVMELECRANGVATPALVVHDPEETGHGPAFFEFDPEHPGTGTVHLWPHALAEEPSGYAALLFTVHETRHSWQFQTAFSSAPGAADPVLVAAFAAGFRAQKALGRKLSFCDFCTMHHEHEAFQSGNQIVGELTGWTVSQAGMGCWSSQFDAVGHLKIDLVSLARAVGAANLRTAFNEREKGQFVEEGGQP